MLSAVDTEEKLTGISAGGGPDGAGGVGGDVGRGHREVFLAPAGAGDRIQADCDGDRTMKEQFEARMLRIFFGESRQVAGQAAA
jgi:hypothetical protein